jgi:hypothetical protein
MFDVSAWGKRKVLWHFCFMEMWVETLFTDLFILKFFLWDYIKDHVYCHHLPPPLHPKGKLFDELWSKEYGSYCHG